MTDSRSARMRMTGVRSCARPVVPEKERIPAKAECSPEHLEERLAAMYPALQGGSLRLRPVSSCTSPVRSAKGRVGARKSHRTTH